MHGLMGTAFDFRSVDLSWIPRLCIRLSFFLRRGRIETLNKRGPPIEYHHMGQAVDYPDNNPLAYSDVIHATQADLYFIRL